LLTQVRRAGEVSLQDVGFVDAVRGGKVLPVAAVAGFGAGVLLGDGSALGAQAVSRPLPGGSDQRWRD
jgi:putative flavoprotein involved in K+ transport